MDAPIGGRQEQVFGRLRMPSFGIVYPQPPYKRWSTLFRTVAGLFGVVVDWSAGRNGNHGRLPHDCYLPARTSAVPRRRNLQSSIAVEGGSRLRDRPDSVALLLEGGSL